MRKTLLAGLLLTLASGALWAQSAGNTAETPAIKSAPLTSELLDGLRKGGYLVFFRHGLTPNYKDPIDRDPDDPRPGDCSSQRNLSAEGIEQSRAIGEAFRELEIPIGIVRASPMCRAMDTAWYAFGRYERDRNILLHGTNPEKDPPEAKVWKNIQNIARIPPLPMTNSVFSSHGTVGEVFGAGYLEEGEAVIVKPDGQGKWSLVARVKSDEWRVKQ